MWPLLAEWLPSSGKARWRRARSRASDVIANPAEALNVFDFEEAAHRKVPPAHWAYMTSGVDDDGTIRANREGFKHIELRPRRLRDATKVDMRVDLFGTTYNSPIFTCPTGGEKSFHPDGELAVARAAKARGTLQFLSTATSTGGGRGEHGAGPAGVVSAVCSEHMGSVRKNPAARGSLGMHGDRPHRRYDDRAATAKRYLRTRPKDLRQCAACHEVKGGDVVVAERPMYDGIDMTGVRVPTPATGLGVRRSKFANSGKGNSSSRGSITREDARLSVEHGIDGILVSNHGGRATETLRATIEALPEVVAEVNGRIPVFVDGGFRRGTDVFKALALGAKAVGIGRPMLWGLGAFGQPGVDRVLEILQGELKLVMGNCGTQDGSRYHSRLCGNG